MKVHNFTNDNRSALEIVREIVREDVESIRGWDLCDNCHDFASWASIGRYSIHVCTDCKEWYQETFPDYASPDIWYPLYADEEEEEEDTGYTVCPPEPVFVIVARHEAEFERRRLQRMTDALNEYNRGGQGEYMNIAAPNGEIIQVRIDAEESFAWRV